MHDRQERLRQLATATRLQAMRREREQRQQLQTLRALSVAQSSHEREIARHESVRSELEALSRTGVALDPALHEQRLWGHEQSGESLRESQRRLAAAQAEHKSATQALLSSKAAEDVACRAYANAKQLLQQHTQQQQALDVFDAQSRRSPHGL